MGQAGSMNHIGILEAGTPFQHIFEKSEVPLKSVYPCRPYNDAPLSYAIDRDRLTSLQVELIALKLGASSVRSCTYKDCVHLIAFGGLALDCKWFIGTVSRPGDSELDILNPF